MNLKNALLLIVLAALWGASFLFIRVGVAEFGVAPLMALRVGIGALFLVALMLTRYAPRELIALLRQHARPLFVVGLLNSAAPSACSRSPSSRCRRASRRSSMRQRRSGARSSPTCG